MIVVPKTELLGIDPGLATGLAAINIQDRSKPEVLWSNEVSVEQFHNFIEDYVREHEKSLVIVIEDYIITKRTADLSAQPYSLHLIGVVLFLSHKYGVPVVFHNPSDKKFAEDNNRLRGAGWWHKGGEGHANDAFRHAMKFCADRSPEFARSLLI